MANAALDKTISPIVGSYMSLAIAFVVIAAISAIVATQVGGKTRRQRKATFSLVSAICFLVYVTIIFPKILGIGSPNAEPAPSAHFQATPTARVSPTNRLVELRKSQLIAIAQSELASNRAQCFLRISGKDTTALAQLHTELVARNMTILDAHLDQITDSGLETAEKLAKDMLVGAAEVEQQVTLTKQSMAPDQLALANQVCPRER